ncbi:hypothetical protein JNW90_23635 [Micromonospora sp. STR1s_5]|nr:hypothetical protein [Micromonospora sp. STR1s_5]
MAKMINRSRKSREDRVPRSGLHVGMMIGGLLGGADILVTAMVLLTA